VPVSASTIMTCLARVSKSWDCGCARAGPMPNGARTIASAMISENARVAMSAMSCSVAAETSGIYQASPRPINDDQPEAAKIANK
jgi:hypothetical protein